MLFPNGNSAMNQPDARFSCKKCEFYTNKSCNYNAHLKTNKHKNTSITFQPVEELLLSIQESDQPATTELTSSRKTYPCKKCNKPYLSKKGVWQHSKKCQLTPLPAPEILNKETVEFFTTTITALRNNNANLIKTNQIQAHMIKIFALVIESITNVTS